MEAKGKAIKNPPSWGRLSASQLADAMTTAANNVFNKKLTG